MNTSSEPLDCIIIGYNEPDLQKVMTARKAIRQISGSYREMLHKVVRYQGKWLSYIDLLNTILYEATQREYGLHVMNTPYLGVCYLTSFLKRRNFNVEMINFYTREKERLISLLQQNPRAVAISTTLYVENDLSREIVQLIKQYNSITTIIVGGPYIFSSCTLQEDIAIQDYLLREIGADVYIHDSQGEATLAKVLQELRNKGKPNLEHLPNLLYKTNPDHINSSAVKKSVFVRTPRVPENNGLDENLIDWSVFPKKFYTPTAYIRTSRGCAFACAFCNFPLLRGSLCFTSLESLEREMTQLANAGVKQLVFVDDTLNVPLPRFKKMLRMMIAKQFHFQWFSFFRCSHTDDETFDLMQQSGCQGVYLGIESGDQSMLRRMNKQTTLEAYKKSIRQLHERDILTYASFIVGFPGETQESVQNTIHFIEDTQLTYYKANLYNHSHALPIHRHAAQYGLRGIGYGWQHHTMDWQEASTMLENMYLTVKNSLIFPTYMLGFWAIPYLLGKGMSLKQLHEFIKQTQPLLLQNFSSEAMPINEEQTIFEKPLTLAREIAQNIKPDVDEFSCHKQTSYPKEARAQQKKSKSDLSKRIVRLFQKNR
ncbi:MAG: radical SAM protein [bacterium]|nr:radical SAM protein [bacterium]